MDNKQTPGSLNRIESSMEHNSEEAPTEKVTDFYDPNYEVEIQDSKN